MSADNWAVCPACYAAAQQEQDEKKKALEKDYGKIPPKEFVKKTAELEEVVSCDDFRTFREDYELGTYDDSSHTKAEFFVTYSGVCTECGLKKEFRHEEKIDLKPFVKKIRKGKKK